MGAISIYMKNVLKGLRSFFAAALLLVAFVCAGVSDIMAQVPQRPQPPKLVNDLAGLLGGAD